MNLVNFFWLVEKFVIILNSRLVICNTTHFNQYMVKNQSKKHDFFSHRIFFIMLVNSGLHWLLTCDEKDNKNTWKYDMNTSVAKARRVLPASHLLRRAVRRQSLCKLCTVAMNELLCSKNSGAYIDLTVYHLIWVIGIYGNWKNQNPGGRFGATS